MAAAMLGAVVMPAVDIAAGMPAERAALSAAVRHAVDTQAVDLPAGAMLVVDSAVAATVAAVVDSAAEPVVAAAAMAAADIGN